MTGTLLTTARAARSLIQSVAGRVISFTMGATFVFMATLYTVPVAQAATTCPTSGNNVTIAADCNWDPGTYTFTGTLTVNPGVYASGGLSSSPGQVVLISDNITVNGVLHAGALGYGPNSGPGQGAQLYAGGSYGGYGGLNTVNGPYGSITQPTDLGSGGYTNPAGGYGGGAGGGALKLVVSGTLTVNGLISADGTGSGGTCNGNGGSGGSIWIIATTVQGSSVIRANGGPGSACAGVNVSGGGGGRIAVEWSVAGTGFPTISAQGSPAGFPGQAGGAGTIYTKGPGSTFGNLTIDNGDMTQVSAKTPLVAPTNQTYDNLSVKNYAQFDIPAGYTLTVNPGGSISGSGGGNWINLVGPTSVLNAPSVTTAISGVSVACTGQLGVVKNLTHSGGTFDDNECNFSAGLDNLTVGSGGIFRRGANTTRVVTGNITVQSGGIITHKANSTSKLHTADFQATNITVNIGGVIHGDAMGYTYNNGPGKGPVLYTGGSYGGWGGTNTVNGPYGSITQPTDLGSGGFGDGTSGNYGGPGGGVIKLVASGTLTNNGSIRANGVGTDFGYIPCASTGGSGGSIWLDAATLAGTGTVSATGGDAGTCGGGNPLSGGGGGRIAIYYGVSTASLTRNVYGGARTGAGIDPSQEGGSGTIFEKGASQSFGNLTVDRGARTYDQPTTLVAPATQTYDSISSKNGGILDITSGYAVTVNTGGAIGGGGASRGSVRVSSGATLSLPGPSFTLNDAHVVVYGTLANVQNLTIQNSNLDYYSGTFPDLVNANLGSGGNWRFATTANLNLPGTLTVQNGGNLTHFNNTTAQDYVVNLTAANVDVQSGGLIDLNSRGYSAMNGPGGGAAGTTPYMSGTGAGHGGVGGPANSADPNNTVGGMYDSAASPSQLGSGGGTNLFYSRIGGSGGGAAKLTVSGTLTVNGTVRADGATSEYGYSGYSAGGGGSGGSLWFDVGTITGNGVISAKGGDRIVNSGCGGGGRIALYFSTNSFTGATPSVAPGIGPGCAAGSLNFVPSSDTVAPSVSPVTPITAEVGVSTTFSAAYSDAVGVTSCTFFADGADQGAMSLVGTTSGTASMNYTYTTTGPHTAQVTCSDAATNVGTGALTTITVSDTIAPDTIIDSGPSTPTNQTSATFTFHATEPSSTFECNLDGAGFTSCVSGVSYSGLAVGSHTFQVRAIDPVSNVDPTPASYTWTITSTTTICTSLTVAGGSVSTCITNPDGSVTVTMVGSQGRTYIVTLPAGTTPQSPNTTIIITIQDRRSRPAVLIRATLPAGMTKTAQLPRPSGRAGRTVCINDRTNASFLVNPRRCPDAPGQKLINLPGNSGTISTTLNDAIVRTIMYTQTTINVSGLQNSLVEFTGHKVKFNRHRVGTGSHPQTTKEVVSGAIVKVFDRSSGSCGASIGFQSNKYQQIFTTCAPALSDTTDEEGDLWFDDLGDGNWFAISMDPVTQTYAGVAFRDFDKDIDYEPLQVIVSANGKASSGKTSTMKGSLLDIVEPESIEWDSTQELYPFVLDAVDGDWNITVTVTPPEGFVADQGSLSDQVVDATKALQFTLTDVGSCWECGTDVTFTVKHKGKVIKRTSKIRTPMTEAFAKKKGLKVKDLEAKGVVITKKGEGKKVSFAPRRAATFAASVPARTTVEPGMQTRSISLSEAISSLVRSRYSRYLSLGVGVRTRGGV